MGKISRQTEAERLRHDAIKNLNIDPITYPHTIHRKRHVGKKSLFATSHDDISMSTSSDSELFTDDPLYEEERDLIPKLPGQTTDDIKAPTRQVFEYVYKNFTDSNARKYLENIQPWLYFRRQHNRPDYSLPVLDHTGKEYPDLINWMLHDIDTLPANAQKLQDTQQTRKKQHIKTVPTDTSKTQHSDTVTPAQTTTSQKQSTSISHTLATTINKQTGTSGTPPPPSPSPPHNNTPTSSPDSSPDRMPSLRDRAIFFPQTTFDGKDKSKTRAHLQSFEDFVDRQKLDPATDFKEIQEYFLMTLRDLARQWFSSTTFTSYDDMKKKFTQEYSEYGKTP